MGKEHTAMTPEEFKSWRRSRGSQEAVAPLFESHPKTLAYWEKIKVAKWVPGKIREIERAENNAG